MTSPISETLVSTGVSPSQLSAQRERVDNILNHLNTEGSVSEAPPAREDLVKPVERINEAMRPYGVQFELSEEASRVITRIVDQENGEVIRQIPAEAVLRVAENLPEVEGLLFRQEV